MIELVKLLPELIEKLKAVVEDPDTYARLEGMRVILEKVTGKEIPKNALVELLEEATQEEAYSGKWEQVDETTRRLRVDGAWIYDIGRGNGLVVRDA
jgi:hypothetical protein